VEKIRLRTPLDYISCGETSEKVGCSIRSAWVGAGAAFDEHGHGEVWGSKGEWKGTRSVFLWPWFSCVEQKDHQEGFFFNLGCTGREARCCRGKLSDCRENRGEIVRRKAKGSFIESECLMVQHDFQQRGERFLKQQRDKSGGETARNYFAGTSVITLPNFFWCITEEGEPSWGGV